MKVLIVRVGAMGDVLHALPAVTALRRARPDWEIDWVVDPRWAPLLVNGEGVGSIVRRVHLADTRLWKKEPLSLTTMRSVRDLRRELRAEAYDLVVDMQGTLRSAVIGRMAGANEFAGYADPRESAAARLYKTPLQRRGTHVVDQGAALLGEATGVELAPAFVELPREESAEKWAAEEAEVVRPVCVLGPGGGWGAKQWPAEKFGELAQALRAKGFDVVVNAARADDAVALQVVDASRGASAVMACDVAMLVAMLRRTDLFVGGDTGPMHLAAMLGVPVVALFGPTDPARNGPWGPGVCRVLRNASSVTNYKRVDAVDAGLEKIGVGEVLEAVQKLSVVSC
jgi:heptosyltransferase-1